MVRCSQNSSNKQHLDYNELREVYTVKNKTRKFRDKIYPSRKVFIKALYLRLIY